jgi:hypothetical protein
MGIVNNIEEFCKKLGVEIDYLEKAIYKSTNCGAWIEILTNGIRLGSIVEGCDFDTETYTLLYPFTIQEFNKVIEMVEEEAEDLWEKANGDNEEKEE